MKKTTKNLAFSVLLGSFIASSHQSYAALAFVVTTDAVGALTNTDNSWVGNAGLNGNATTGTAGAGQTNTFVTGLQNGTFSFAPVTSPAEGVRQASFGPSGGTTGVSLNFVVTGGVADLEITTNNRIRLINLSDTVTSISVTTTFTNLVASRNNVGVTSLPLANNNALGVGIGTTAGGNVFSDSETITVSYGNARVLSSDGLSYTPLGLTSGGQFVAGTDSDGFVSSADGGSFAPSEQSQTIQAFDIDGDGTATLEERKRFYFDTVTTTISKITRNDGTETPGYSFTFDGGQFSDSYSQVNSATAIPEPSVSLLALSSLAVLVRRKRV